MYLYIVFLSFENERTVRTKTGGPIKNEKLEYFRISMKHQLMQKIISNTKLLNKDYLKIFWKIYIKI